MEWDSCSRLFRTNSNEPFAPFFVGTKKFLESFTPSRLHFKCKFQAWFELSNIIISQVSRFLSSSGSRWSFLKPSFGSTINICLRINNYARISSFISCPQFFFFFNGMKGWLDTVGGMDTSHEVERSFQQDGGF